MKRGDHRAAAIKVQGQSSYKIFCDGPKRDVMHSWRPTTGALARLARTWASWTPTSMQDVQGGRGGSIHVASLDVEKAFGQIDAWAVKKAMQDHGAPAWAIAAVLRELVDQHALPTVAGVSCDVPVVGKRCSARRAGHSHHVELHRQRFPAAPHKHASED